MAIKKTAIPPKPSAAEKFVSGRLTTESKPESKPESKSSKSIVQTPPIETEKTKLKRLTLDISEELHRSIKMKSVSLGIPMVDMLRTLLDKNYGNP